MAASGSRSRGVSPQEYDELARDAVRQVVPSADLEAMAFGFGLVRVANRFQQDVEAHIMRPAGLTYAAFRVMFCIRIVGPVPPKEIARHSNVSQATISSVVNTLERRKLVTRTPSTDDGRGVIVGLTHIGETTVTQLLHGINERESRWLAALPADERSRLVRTLRSLLHREL
ncbi:MULTISPECIES: MarR family winged helix-turn-helix transcriptional regulator [unclassified Pseudonocardia]|uniref:MarR family winged helix-turn-helix transcriptional regulator n=1 Tax=unclassified Pseudonocardia TaxID=2619320 RepID=UPI0011150BDF|nr:MULTISPECIES: MarR family winged helix-turn-helix transcriptional regulator [unclassified Pseudonocardia]